MPEVSSYVSGTPCWVDVSSPDLDATVAFYTGLFGWDALPPTEPEAGGYTIFAQGGKSVAGVGPIMGGSPPMWNTYIASDDVDATAASVVEAGGTVLVEPFDVMDAGRMAVAFDPTGGGFGVWQAGRHIGAQLVNEPVGTCWNELRTSDAVAANAFYAAVFGWTHEPFGDDPSFAYDVQKIGDQMVAGIFQTDGAPCWHVYFAVADADATAAQAVELGGSVVREPADFAWGRDTLLSDSHGAVFHALRTPGE